MAGNNCTQKESDSFKAKEGLEGFVGCEDRLKILFDNIAQSLYQFEVRPPIPTNLPLDKQIDQILDQAILVSSNKGQAETYGYSKDDEVFGLRLCDFFHKDLGGVKESLRDYITDGYRFINHVSCVHMRTEEYRWILRNCVGMIENGCLTCVIGSSLDVTERIKTEEKLKEREEQFRTLISNIPGIVYRCALDSNWTLHYISEAVETLTGYKPEDFIGKKTEGFARIIHPDDWQYVEAEVSAAVKRKRTYTIEYRIIHKDGTVKWVYEKGQAVCDEHGEVLCLDGAIFDITERKQTEQKLMESEQRYRRVVEDQAEFIVRWQPDGVRTFVNDAYCQYYGLSREEATGTGFFPHISREDLRKVKKRIKKLSLQNPVSSAEHKVILPDGSIGWNYWTDRAIFDEKDNLIEYQSVGRDSTELKKAEHALRESESALREQKKVLEQKNAALREVLDLIEREKQEIKNQVIANIDHMIKPSLEKLKLKGGVRKHVHVIERHMEDLATSFGKKITEQSVKLTAREVEVCGVIKSGLTNKEIAKLLNISIETVEKHRRHIRKKLGISRKNINLTTYLRTL